MGGKTYTHRLVVIGIFARRRFTRPVEGTPSQDVMDTLKEIAVEHGHPRGLNFDKGQNVTGATFETYFGHNSKPQRVNDPKT